MSRCWIVLLSGIIAMSAPCQLPARAASCAPITTFCDGNVPDREVFVAVDGSDPAGDGSELKPFRTLARAVQGVRPGTAIRLFPGTHAPGAFISGLAGTDEAPIWIGGAPGRPRPTIAGGSEGLHLSRVRYVVIEHLEISGSSANGINCDDGGDVANPEATRFVVFRDLVFRDIGSGGNQDALKLSGVNDYWVLDCAFVRGSAGGSGIDHVGCHRGRIVGCRFEAMGSNAVQCKGGSEDLEILGCDFVNAGQRAINLGGSTGFEFFRPPLKTGELQVEARNIRVLACVFQGSDAPIAFVGSVGCLVANNTLINPTRWIARVLQETVSGGGYSFAACGESRFINNLVYFSRAGLSTFINVGPNTAPSSFTFANNLWYAHDNPTASNPNLPVAESGGIVRKDPEFTSALAGDYTLRATSPAVGMGRAIPELSADFARRCFAAPPTIGAHEFKEVQPAMSDADRMPDWWEKQFGLDALDPSDAALDPDGDGHPNEAEFFAATDPLDRRSGFRILDFRKDAAGLLVRFSTVPQGIYRLEQTFASAQLKWVEESPITGNGEVVEARIALPQSVVGVLIRVRVNVP